MTTNQRSLTHIFDDTHLNFLHFSLIGWGIFWCGDVVFILLQSISAGEIAAQALDAPIGLLLSFGYRMIYRRIEYKRHSIPALLVLIFFWSTVFSLVWHVPMTLTRYALVGAEAVAPLLQIRLLVQWLSRTMPVWFCWSTLYFVIRYWHDWDRERTRVREMEELAQQAQLQMLRYQVHPHFLFNALNSVRALIDEDQSSARVMISELTEFLRYSLANRDSFTVPLSAELEAIRYYLGIEKKRFEQKLEVIYNIDERANEFPVLSFLMHPLVENAVKYGMKTSALPLRLHIETTLTDTGADIIVANSGQWTETGAAESVTADGTGTGLENVRARLANSYPDRHRFEIRKTEGWVSVRIHLQGAA